MNQLMLCTYGIKRGHSAKVLLIVALHLLILIDLLTDHDPERIGTVELVLRNIAHLRLGVYLVLGSIDHSYITSWFVLGLVSSGMSGLELVSHLRLTGFFISGLH